MTKHPHVISWFEQQVKATPDNIAVEFGTETITYASLNDKANQLANHLINNQVHKKGIIGLCIDRSIDLIITVLGILKTGSAYLPLDPSYPSDRIQYMIDSVSL